jgi:hypothetical protein
MSKSRSQKQTLARSTGVSAERLSKKIQLVRREDPNLTSRQAAGKAAGILRHRQKK